MLIVALNIWNMLILNGCSVNICELKINKSANQKRNTQIFTFLNPRLKCECPSHLDYDYPSKFPTRNMEVSLDTSTYLTHNTQAKPKSSVFYNRNRCWIFSVLFIFTLPILDLASIFSPGWDQQPPILSWSFYPHFSWRATEWMPMELSLPTLQSFSDSLCPS